MKTIAAVVGLLGATIFGVANAQCPRQLSPEELIQCIVVEDSGQNYREYLAGMEDPEHSLTDFDNGNYWGATIGADEDARDD
jgi:hypothetical protein